MITINIPLQILQNKNVNKFESNINYPKI